ncbi:MAG: FAD-dependent oxidoreductase [Verrucomicrobiaceae bacterium]
MSRIFHGALRNLSPTRRPTSKEASHLVIVGNGMVGAKLCEALVEEGLNTRLNITVIGGEPVPAYNRVKLSTYVDHRDPEKLETHPLAWYQEHNITLNTGVRVTAIDRDSKTLTLSSGDPISYTDLVIATGSRPFVPPIPGSESDKVFLYRTLEDLDRIITAADGKKSATVIGGGLLGLEAAQALQSLNLQTAVIERANFLMPQQLDQRAAEILENKIKDQKIDLHLGIQNTRITEQPKGKGLELTLDQNTTFKTDLVVISAGIKPNSEIAEDANLPIGVRGGIVVNGHLETEDPHIFAIGECALLHGRTYGLVAPGYAMAKHFASRFAGKKLRPLEPLDMSTRLKMLGVSVTTIGEPLQESQRLEFIEGDTYRMLAIGRKRTLLGALAIGPWNETGQIQSNYLNTFKISRKQETHFLKHGELFPNQTIEDPSAWPENRIVCNCLGISKGQINACRLACQNDPDLVARKTGASTVCGSCSPLVAQLCGTVSTFKRPRLGIAALLITSVIALLATISTIVFPGVSMADSVESTWYKIDQLWRDNFIKQITGYSLVGIFLIGLIISLRKRFSWFTWGQFTTWRFFHSAFGLISLGALWVHTGFHFGSNLNFWLMAVFVLLNLLGAVAGIITAIESKGTWSAARRLRPILTWAHLILFWPLPVLITFHVMSVYLY